METVEVCCGVKNEDGRFVLYPRTNLDRRTLSTFINEQGRYVNVRLMNRVQSKTRDQDKAFWGLLNIYYQSLVGSKPTSNELQWFYDELRADLLPLKDGIINPDRKLAKHWSELTKEEGVNAIARLMSLVVGANNIPENEALSCRDVFFWIQQEKNALYKDPSDYHEDGSPLTLDEWSDMNRQCMVTGIIGGDICHIVSRGEGKGLEWLVNQSWNLYRCHHGIHIDIQHGKPGWEGLFSGFDYDIGVGSGLQHYEAPWLRKRYERARRLFDEGRMLSNRGYSPEEITRHLAYSENQESDVPIQHEYETESLVSEAIA